MNEFEKILNQIIEKSELIGQWNRFIGEVDDYHDPNISYYQFKIRQLESERKELYEKLIDLKLKETKIGIMTNDYWNEINIPKEFKDEFFNKLNKLCNLYSVNIKIENIKEQDKNNISISPAMLSFEEGNEYYIDSQFNQDLYFSSSGVFEYIDNGNDMTNVKNIILV